MFLWALVALGAKALELTRQRHALRRRLLPAWTGTTVPVTEAETLLRQLDSLPRGRRSSLVGQRVVGALEFVQNRGSTDGLDDHLRAQADNDANAVEGSYSLIRFIPWAIPILGFLGTVLGITEAIANVTPEQLATSISGVTGGLAIAFDTTAIALMFSMVLMFLSFVLDRGEQGVLQAVDAYAEKELAHRFERHGAEGNELLGVVGKSTQVLVQAIEQLVQRQAELWARSLTSLQSRLEQSERQQHERVIATLTQALDRSLKTHQERMVDVEKKIGDEMARGLLPLQGLGQQLRDTATALEKQGQRAAEHATLLQPLLDGEQQILRLQESLQQNLDGLARAGSFEQAVHSLTAAIHLLTARVDARPAPASLNRARPGNAA
jgi:biopolymer transport protein ExbB/TolQ